MACNERGPDQDQPESKPSKTEDDQRAPLSKEAKQKLRDWGHGL
jgi:hypothetical protein